MKIFLNFIELNLLRKALVFCLLFSFVACSSSSDESGNAAGEEIDVSTFDGDASGSPTDLPSSSIDGMTGTIECDASSTTSGGLLAVECPNGGETVYAACDDGDVVIAPDTSGNGTRYDCSSVTIECDSDTDGNMTIDAPDGCDETEVDVGDYSGGSTGIDELAEGYALYGTVNGVDIQILEEDARMNTPLTVP